MSFYNKYMLSTLDWGNEELLKIIDVAKAMKNDRHSPDHGDILRNRLFGMLFFNSSTRTRNSFSAAATELGGTTEFLEPRTMRLAYDVQGGESLEDVAKVLSGYMCGVGIRLLEDRISRYGEGHEVLEEFAHYASVPVINMGDDKFHPCQGLADVMGLQEHLGDDLSGKKIVVTWAKGALARSRYSAQEVLLMSSRFGMDVVLAHPEGYELDPEIVETTRRNCQDNSASFEISNSSLELYEKAHVVYSRNWASPEAYQDGYFNKDREIQRALDPKYADWICTSEKMALTDNALFLHPMPVDRGNEVTNEVASGRNSIIYDVAENRLHVQKAIMALTMNEGFSKKCVG